MAAPPPGAEFLPDRERLLAALRDRQVLLERVSGVQRAIVDHRPLGDVLEAVVEAACELLGDELGTVRRAGPGGGIVASLGIDGHGLNAAAEITRPGLGSRAAEERRIVVVDAVSGGDRGLLEAEFGGGLAAAGIAAPVNERGEAVAALAVGSRDAGREYGSRDQQVLYALAELAGLALEHARAIADVAREAFRDRLTGLPNRALLVDRARHALARAEETDVPVGILLCDLDDFKTVNDSLGHAAGDGLLVAVGERLRECGRRSDTVARLGGDEFAILLEELDDPGDAARSAQRVLEALEPPFSVGAREIYVAASVGVAVGGADAETLLRDADLAMYRAKSEGKGRYALFEPALHTAIVDRLELEGELKRAIDGDELELVYQPVFSLRGGAIAWLEALVRWRHPTRGVVNPDRFIPLAEQSGQIGALGQWVLREACRQGALWRARYPGFPGLQVGVNISGVQLREPGLVEQVEAALTTAQLDPAGLTLEITETALMEDVGTAAARLFELKALGVELAIDDFGRGYSSLAYLQRFPLDNLKIDRHFIAEIHADEQIPKLLRAIVDLAEIFDLRPIAEGIERHEQLDYLLELGCELGQGHLLSEPLSPADADSLLFRVGLLGAAIEPGDSPLPSPADAGAAPPAGPAARRRHPGGGAGLGGR